MNTKEKILDAALSLFSERGYNNVRMVEIADAVGIKAPSIYKHYTGKQGIFEAILLEMRRRYDVQARAFHIHGSDPTTDAVIFSQVSEDGLVRMGQGLFSYFLHDDYVRKFRKMLTTEQFRCEALAQLFTRYYADDPLLYQSSLLAAICESHDHHLWDPAIMALQFYSPIYLLLTICDRDPQREPEALLTLEQHIRQFNRIYHL